MVKIQPIQVFSVIVRSSVLCVALSLPAAAQDAQDLISRAKALQASDPQLFNLLVGVRREIDGGFDVHFSEADLDCQDWGDGTLTGCEASISVEVQSHADSIDRRDARVDVSCSIDFTATDDAGGNWSGDEEETTTINVGSGSSSSDEISLDLDTTIYDPVVSMRIDSQACLVRSID